MDVHDSARDELAKMGKIYDRKPVKNTNLGLIYGMGKGKLAQKNDMSVEEAGELKRLILQLYPGLKDMYKDMKQRAKAKEPIHTWGGREYYCEEPALIKGRIWEFDYKLVNVLIQGSAADCTKEAIIRYWKVKHKDARLLLNVHDQLTVSVPKKIWKQEMEVLRKCMESIETDVQMLTEGKMSETNWHELVEYDTKGKVVYGTKKAA
jgi:DNA polymerase I-like protein with 3'-5' exonuclease and polymerase domains